MSDIGLFPPGAAVFLGSLVLAIAALVCAGVCALVLWLRHDGGRGSWLRKRLFSFVVGALVCAMAAGATSWLIDSSGSLGVFSRWIDQPMAGIVWVGALVAIWPLAAYFWHRHFALRPREPAHAAPDR